MEQLMEHLKPYLENGLNSIVMLALVGIVLGFFLRNPIKALLAGIFGYRAKLDDYAFSEHKNKDIIYNNEVARLNTGIDIKNAGLLFASIMSLLISPLLAGTVFVFQKIMVTKQQLSKITDYTIYDDVVTDDEFVNFLNKKGAKVNLVVDEIYFTGYVFIAIGLAFDSYFLAGTGLAVIALLLVATALMLYNAFMYRLNYKYVDYYRVMRLIQNSKLGGNSSLLILAIFSFASNFTALAGFSVYAWSVFAIKLFITFTLNNLLKKEDDINKEHQQIENRDYTNIENIASYPNAISQSRGYKFSTALQMKFFEIEKKEINKNLIHIDNYAFYPQAINRTDLRKNPLLYKTLSNAIKIYIEALDVTKQLVILGGMGSGKTEMINYIVEQVHNSNFTKFQAIAFNDTKGDFSKDFYREDRDIIVNLYDSRAKVFDFFEEMNTNIEAGTAFINNLFESLAGNEKDFFNASAKQKTAIWVQESYYATNNSVEAWKLFFNKIKAYREDIQERDDKTQSSIMATIEIALEILSIMYYQIVVEKRETFTFYDFVHNTDVQLFFVNNKQFEAKLTPYLSGLTATYINTIMSKEDTKKHLILNVFDEFLTMKIDNETRKTLLTATRSKGFSNVFLAQYLEKKDEAILQQLDSSRYALITFNINDEFTLNAVAKKFSEMECLALNSSPQQQDNQSSARAEGNALSAMVTIPLSMFSGIFNFKKKNQLSYSLSESKVIYEQQLQSLPKYHHLTFIPSEELKVVNRFDAKRFFRLMAFGYDNLMSNIAKTNDFLARESGILYLGYTPRSTLSIGNKSFEKWDMREFYSFNEIKQREENRIFDDEKEEFIHYLNIKFAGTVDEAKEYIKANGLERYDINKMFENVEEDNKKIQKLLKTYSEQQRYDLMKGFFDIDSENLEAKYEYCKEHDLIGCILGIFTFSEEFKKSVLGLEAGADVELNSSSDEENATATV